MSELVYGITKGDGSGYNRRMVSITNTKSKVGGAITNGENRRQETKASARGIPEYMSRTSKKQASSSGHYPRFHHPGQIQVRQYQRRSGDHVTPSQDRNGEIWLPGCHVRYRDGGPLLAKCGLLPGRARHPVSFHQPVYFEAEARREGSQS